MRLEDVSPQDGSQESGKPAADRVMYGHSHSPAQRGNPCIHVCNARRVKRPKSEGVKKLRQCDDQKGRDGARMNIPRLRLMAARDTTGSTLTPSFAISAPEKNTMGISASDPMAQRRLLERPKV